MPGFLDRLVTHHKKNKARAANFDFFKACMAAAAMMTMADGKADKRESASLKALFRVLDEFKTYNRRQGMDLYDGFIADLEADPAKGQAGALAAVAQVKDNPEWAALLVAVCATLSAADGRVQDAEAEVIDEICARLELDPAAIKAYEVDFYDELHE